MACLEDFDQRADGHTRIHVRRLVDPIILRNGTSDFAVFRQVFLDRQYDLPAVSGSRFIVDAGANIGLSSLFFLSQNPTARIIAIEPDIENFEIALQNLQPFRDRCELVHAALWPESGTVSISRAAYRDGRHWATQTKAITKDASETVRAFTLTELLAQYSFPRVDFLKLDIEGSELAVFQDGDTGFLDFTHCCAIECHDERCTAAVAEALRKYPFTISERGELTVAERMSANDI